MTKGKELCYWHITVTVPEYFKHEGLDGIDKKETRCAPRILSGKFQ